MNMDCVNTLIFFVAVAVSLSNANRLPTDNWRSRDVLEEHRDTNSSVLIAGGKVASPGQFPWEVSIQVTNCRTGWHLCGGTLISSEWVLTAAHCLDHEKPPWIWVVTGDHDLNIEEGNEQYLLADYFIQHPNYQYFKPPYPDDVGLIHLSTPAIINSFTQTARLPSLSSETFQGPLTEYGWGHSFDGGLHHKILHYADNIQLRDPSDCTAAYGITHPTMLCAGQEGVGFCVGDNGGGLQTWSIEEDQWVIGAILSWRDGCVVKEKPGVYYSLPSYMNWIQETIAQEYPWHIHHCA